ncbi:hypothetical protein BT96DRAFT_1003064 [Gymnopus androsaceus JB14]|uniref:Uncharacterized protein n=1 Tax=Gymnopus androsaceus JB14 TaxID=1447944 RepID=A0A6A4GUU0_9AGAR|nr:hypothetical protein BT96DRAFT_1003064 [Gymnopus androsaceus JB14]
MPGIQIQTVDAKSEGVAFANSDCTGDNTGTLDFGDAFCTSITGGPWQSIDFFAGKQNTFFPKPSLHPQDYYTNISSLGLNPLNNSTLSFQYVIGAKRNPRKYCHRLSTSITNDEYSFKLQSHKAEGFLAVIVIPQPFHCFGDI